MSQRQSQTDFDFSGLFELLNTMKRKFWNYDRAQERYSKQRGRLNNQFFSKQNPRGEQSVISRKIHKALVGAVEKSKKIQSKSIDGMRNNGQTFFEDVLGDDNTRQNDAELNEILGLSGGEIDEQVVQQVLRNPLISSIIEEMRKKQLQQEGIDIDDQRKNIKTQKQGILTRKPSQISNQIDSRVSKSAMDSRAKGGKFAQNQLPLFEKAQKEKVAQDWFKSYIKYNEKEEKDKQAQYKEKQKRLEKDAQVFFSDQIHSLRYDEYQEYLDDEQLRDKLANMLQDKYDHLKKSSIREISKYIKESDKDLFIKLKEGHYTIDQIRARISERKNGVKYVVLDDMRHLLDPSFFKKSARKKSKYDHSVQAGVNAKKNNNDYYFMKDSKTGRHEGMQSRNYAHLPESLGNVDFIPKYTVDKFEKKPQKSNIQFMFVKPMKIKTIEEIKAEQEQKNPKANDRAKKIQNIQRLKKNLAQKLAIHRQIEISQMPYDSSKVDFQDKYDMFFGLNQKKGENTMKRKKSGSTASRAESPKSSSEKQNKVLFAYEQKKKQQSDRRSKLLFLKKMEQEGSKVFMTPADRDLLKNYGVERLDDEDQIIQDAMDEDLLTTMNKQEMQQIMVERMEKEEDGDVYRQKKILQILAQCAKTQAVPGFNKKEKKMEQKIKDRKFVKADLFSSERANPIQIISKRDSTFYNDMAKTQTQNMSHFNQHIDKNNLHEKIDNLYAQWEENQRATGVKSELSSPKSNDKLEHAIIKSVSSQLRLINQNSANTQSQKSAKDEIGTISMKQDKDSQPTINKMNCDIDGNALMFGNYTLNQEYNNQSQVQDDEQKQSEAGQTSEKRKLNSDNKIIPQNSDIDDVEDDGTQMQPRKIDQIITVGPQTMIRQDEASSQLRTVYIQGHDEKSVTQHQGRDERIRTAILQNEENELRPVVDLADISQLNEQKNLTTFLSKQMNTLSQRQHYLIESQRNGMYMYNSQRKFGSDQNQNLTPEQQFQNMMTNQRSQVVSLNKSIAQKSNSMIHQRNSIHLKNEAPVISEDFQNFANSFGIPVIQKPRQESGAQNNEHFSSALSESPLSNTQQQNINSNNYRTQPLLHTQEYNNNSPSDKIQRQTVEQEQYPINFKNYVRRSNYIKSSADGTLANTNDNGIYSQQRLGMISSQSRNKTTKRGRTSQHPRRLRKTNRNAINIQQNTFENPSQNYTGSMIPDTMSDRPGGPQLHNVMQQRLKTALNINRQRKLNFNQQLQIKNSTQELKVNQGGRFNSNFQVTLKDREDTRADLRSLQFESLQFEMVKTQCKMQNDYKSMAAVTRIQKKNKEDGIQSLQDKILYNQANKVKNRMETFQVTQNSLIGIGDPDMQNTINSQQWMRPNTFGIQSNAVIENLPLTKLTHQSSEPHNLMIQQHATYNGEDREQAGTITLSKLSHRQTQGQNSRVTTGDGGRRNLLQKIGQSHNTGLNINLQGPQTMNPIGPNGVKKLNSNPNEEMDNDPYKQNLKIKQNISSDDQGGEKFLKKDMSDEITPHTETPNLLFDQNYDTSPGLAKKRMDLSQNSNHTGKFMHLSTMNNNGVQKQAEMDQLLLDDQKV